MTSHMAEISVRYIVDDIDRAVDFYTGQLGFEVGMGPGPGFAMLRRNGLHLYLNTPGGGGGAGEASGGKMPEPGGWNRFRIEVEDLSSVVGTLTGAGVDFRGDIVEGRGGRQIIVDDPAGNPIELFEPKSA